MEAADRHGDAVTTDDPRLVDLVARGRCQVLHGHRDTAGGVDRRQPGARTAIRGQHGRQRTRLGRDVEHGLHALLIRLRLVQLSAQQEVADPEQGDRKNRRDRKDPGRSRPTPTPHALGWARERDGRSRVGRRDRGSVDDATPLV